MRPVTLQTGFTLGDLEAAMASRQFVYADCFTIIPSVGSPLRYTSAQQNVTVLAVDEVVNRTYFAGQVIIQGLRARNNLGVEVDQQEIQLSYPATDAYQNLGLTWAQALLQGKLDNASLRRDRYVARDWNSPWIGGYPMFRGLVSTLNKVGRQSATIEVKSDLIVLNRQSPAYLWEPNCKNTWGDPACGVTQSDWSESGIVGSSPTRSKIPWSGAGPDFNLGKIHIHSGDSVTRVRTIARATATDLFLAYPLDFDPVVDQSFTAFPGCSRTSDPTFGCPKYHVSWQEKFKGFPFIPVAETGI